jgi:hypothetical protein
MKRPFLSILGSAKGLARFALATFLLAVGAGCATYDVHYYSIIKCQLSPTPHASFIEANIDLIRIRRISQQLRLPDKTVRQRINLVDQQLAIISAPLGSPDYVLIGTENGSSNVDSGLNQLEEELCRTAAQHGGDVVVIGAARVDLGFVSNSYQAPFGEGSYGPAAQEIERFPRAAGYVFKYVPGLRRENAFLRYLHSHLSDRDLSDLSNQIGKYLNDSTITFEEAQSRIDLMIDAKATAIGAPGAQAIRPGEPL